MMGKKHMHGVHVCVCCHWGGVGLPGDELVFRKAFFLSLLQQDSRRTATPGLRESLYRHVDHRINGQDQSGTYQPTRQCQLIIYPHQQQPAQVGYALLILPASNSPWLQH